MRLPVIDISKIVVPVEQRDLSDLDMLVFISANAVNHFASQGLAPRKHCPIACVGQATYQAAKNVGWENLIQPEPPFNSESLLAHPMLQSVQDKKIMIVRGQGGRNMLLQGLKGRGAKIEYLDVYLRGLPQTVDANILASIRNLHLDLFIVTSNQGLENLLSLVGPGFSARLYKTPLVVISERMLKRAQELGFSGDIQVAHQASNQALIDALMNWHKNQEQNSDE